MEREQIKRLSDDLKAASTTLGRAAVARGMTSESAAKLARKIAALADSQLPKLQEGGRSLVCKAGCNHCCNFMIGCSPEEIALVFEEVSGWPGAKQAELKGRLAAYEEIAAPHRPQWFLRLRTPCPFLDGGLCSVYGSRPLYCRGLSSDNVSLCQEAAARTVSDHVFGPNGEVEAASALGGGLLDAHGLKTPLELPRTIAILLGDPSLLPKLLAAPESFQPKLERPWRKKLEDGGQEWQQERPDDAAFERFKEGRRHSPTRDLPRSASLANNIARLSVASAFESLEHMDEEWDLFLGAIEELEARSGWNAQEAFQALRGYRPIGLGYQVRALTEPMRRLGTLWWERVAKHIAPDLCVPFGKRSPGKIRVGVLGDIGQNSGSGWTYSWIQGLDKRDFETFVFKVDGVENSDAYQFMDVADHYFRLYGPPTEVAHFVRGLDLDYLLLPDFGDRGIVSQMAIFRMARRQAAGWGCPFTTGLPSIDEYLSAGASEPEGAQAHYSEKLIALPGLGFTLDRPQTVDLGLTRADFGLPEGYLVAFPQYTIKWLPSYDSILSELSQRLSNPLVFLKRGSSYEIEAFERRMAQAGVRYQWLPEQSGFRFRALAKLFDCCIDSPGWSGGLTAMHCLSLKVPFVALPGPYFRQRLAVGFCKGAGVPELLCETAQDFVELILDQSEIAKIATRIQPDALFGDRSPLEALARHIANPAH